MSEKQPQRVLVTGASGFLGGRIVEAMKLSGFAQPVGTIRHWTRAARVARHASNVVLCDILDPQSVDAAVKDVDAIIHCAYSGDRASIVEGTQHLLQAAAQHGVTRFVYLSSAEVYDNSQNSDLTEESPVFTANGADYRNAKIEAEEAVREFASKGVHASILRPSLIYGPFSSAWTVDCVKRLQSGKWGKFPQCNGLANLVYVDDLIQAIFLCLTRDEALNETFNVNGPGRVTWNDYFEAWNTTLCLPPLEEFSSTKSQLRTRMMDAVGGLADVVLSRFEDQLMEIYLKGGLASRLMKKIKGELDATPTGNELNDLYARQVYYVDQKARDLLGYQPEFDLSRGLELTHAWLRLHELVGSAGESVESTAHAQAEATTS